jgi:hypothetical protein
MFSVAGLQPDASVAIGNSSNIARSHHLAGEEKDLPAQPSWKCGVAAA